MPSSSPQHEPRLVRFVERAIRSARFYIRPKILALNQAAPTISTQVKQIATTAKQRIREGVKSTAYWSGICVFGLLIAGGIMHISGVPVFSPAHAEGVEGYAWISVIAMNILYFVISLPLAALAAIFAYIFQFVVTYPYGSFWTVTGADSPANGFINVSGVITGWTLVRDVCNVFFAIVLVIIALGTVLRLEGYQYKQMLPIFVSAVILVNFSRMICGVFTDFATIAMATFAGSFGSSFATGILAGFGLPTAFDFLQDGANTQDLNNSGLGTIMLAYVALVGILLFLVPLLIVFSALLILRIIMLWFLIAMSPLAFFCRILPQTKKYSNEWWQRFGSTVSVGPILTFFLWLALTMAFGNQTPEGTASGTTVIGTKFAQESEENPLNQVSGNLQAPNTGPFKAASPNALANFMIMYLMLLAGLRITMQTAGELGSMASKLGGVGEAALNKTGQFFARSGLKLNKASWGGQREGAGGAVARFAGTGAAMLGSTVLQPKEFWGRFKNNWNKSGQQRQDTFLTDVTHEAEGLMSNQVLMQGFGKGSVNMVKKTAGVLWGGGMKNGHGVFDQYLSYQNAENVYRYFQNRDQLTPESKGALVDAVETARTENEAAKNKLTQTEYDDLLQFHQEASGKFARTNELRSNIATGTGDLDFQDGTTRSLVTEKALPVLEAELKKAQSMGGAAGDARAKQIQEQIKQLKYRTNPEQRGAAIADLEKRLRAIGNTKKIKDKAKRDAAEAEKAQIEKQLAAFSTMGNTMSAQDFFANIMGGGAVADEAKKGMDNVLGVKIAQMDKGLTGSMSRLMTAGVIIGDKADNYAVQSTPQTPALVTAEDRQNAEQAFRNAEVELKKNQRLEASFKPKTSVAARLEKNQRTSKAFQEMREVKNSDELVDYVDKAILERNGDTLIGAMLALATNGDMRLLLTDYRSINDDGTTNENASTDAEGLFDFMDKVLVGEMGMTQQEALARLNDVVSVAESNGNMNLSGSIVYNRDKWEAVRDVNTRNQLRAQKMQSTNVSKAVQWGANDWGHTDANGEMKLDVDVAADVLSRIGNDLASDRWWNSLNPNAKLILSHEIDQLRARGVSPQLIERLEEYWQNTGRFEGSPSVTLRQFFQ